MHSVLPSLKLPSSRLSTLFALLATGLAVALSNAVADNRIDVAGEGPDVVLIPDVASDGTSLKPIADYLSRCYRTHALTLAGFAGQSATQEAQPVDWEQAIADYIDHLDARHAIVIGHGFGGFIGLKLAIDHPALVQRLVILDALPFRPALTDANATAGSMSEQADAMRSSFIAQPPEAFRKSQQQALTAMTTHSEAVHVLLDWSLTSSRAAIAAANYALHATDLRAAIAAVRSPTLVLVPWDTSAPEDTATTLDKYRRQYRELREVQVHPIKGSRHFMTLDQPIATNWAIERFLGSCSPAR